MHDWNTCEDCGCEGCSPDCPGPANVGTCERCGSTTSNGRCSDPQGCGAGWPLPARPQLTPAYGD